MFESYKIDMDKPMVLTCGGAVVAPLVSFAASLVTGNIVPVYDVSAFDMDALIFLSCDNRSNSPQLHSTRWFINYVTILL